MCLLVLAAALAPAGPPSADSMRAALSVRRRRCHQITHQLGALAAQSSIILEDQRSHDRTITLRFLRFPATVAAPGFDALSLYRCACGTLTSIHICCRTPGNQETHVQDGAPHLRVPLRCCFLPNRRAPGRGAPCPHTLLPAG